DQREALFRPFQDDRQSHVRDLALPLARRLAERLGGSLEFDCQRSGHFRLTLHVDPGTVEDATAQSWPSSHDDTRAA
ncbi:MAG: ATP-binding protein, partial [Planctomycetota bacterium]